MVTTPRGWLGAAPVRPTDPPEGCRRHAALHRRHPSGGSVGRTGAAPSHPRGVVTIDRGKSWPSGRRGCGLVADDPETLLTDFQVQVAQLFFSLAASDGFLLAGGGALIAQGLTRRPTVDLDFFARPEAGDVHRARDEFTVAAEERGWTVERMRDSDTFCRLAIHGAEELSIDLAVDSVPWQPATGSF